MGGDGKSKGGEEAEGRDLEWRRSHANGGDGCRRTVSGCASVRAGAQVCVGHAAPLHAGRRSLRNPSPSIELTVPPPEVASLPVRFIPSHCTHTNIQAGTIQSPPYMPMHVGMHVRTWGCRPRSARSRLAQPNAAVEGPGRYSSAVDMLTLSSRPKGRGAGGGSAYVCASGCVCCV